MSGPKREDFEEATPGHAISEAEAEDELQSAPAQPGLRHVAARGTIINASFQIGLAGLGTLRRLAVVGFLTREEFGVWGIILPILVTLSWVKQIGVMDKYVQQQERDQETEFHYAFTFELLMSLVFFVVLCVALPLYGLAYGHDEIVLPGIVLAFSVVISAFQTPAWVSYREMQYTRNRLLTSVDPVVAVIVTVVLGALGFGYWCLVIGVVAGSVAGAVVCVAASRYSLRLRFSRERLRSYLTFGWPLLGSGVSRMVVVQGALLTANYTVGLAGIGVIGLATTIATFADRVDGIVSSTIYPAVCRVRDRVDAMAEAFVKSNRIALMWAMPFAVGVALFAGDFVDHVIGEEWRPAVGLLTAIALSCGFAQVGFNWHVFLRAVGRTKPLLVAAVLDLAVFFAVAVPGMLLWGLTGYAAGFAATVVVQFFLRGWYMSRMFPGFNVLRQLVRGVVPVIGPSALILAERALVPDGNSLARAATEMAIYAVLVIASTYVFERRLIRELVGYLRRPRAATPAPTLG